ncbi:hypothetical protein Godav_006305 [Gossypium davidsonii]|uniref:Uncharacterized protein n=1 Tax=Gossypium davidsonii TaxID=34287 RepID=A0A7J8S3F7_GOSDV|nr:hypothetical protein [Gossypium davidsonii]
MIPVLVSFEARTLEDMLNSFRNIQSKISLLDFLTARLVLSICLRRCLSLIPIGALRSKRLYATRTWHLSTTSTKSPFARGRSILILSNRCLLKKTSRSSSIENL